MCADVLIISPNYGVPYTTTRFPSLIELILLYNNDFQNTKLNYSNHNKNGFVGYRNDLVGYINDSPSILMI